MRARPLSNILGAEVFDFQIAHPCGRAEQAELRRLFAEHHLLLIRGQALTDADHDRFAEAFGPLSLMLDGTPAGYVTNKGVPVFGPGTERLLWHSDGTYGEKPGIATSLWAKEVSPEAAPTMFANAVRALDALPAPLRKRIEKLSVVHVRDTHKLHTSHRFRPEDIPADAAPGRFRSYEHPLVYRAPHADLKVINVNELLTSHIRGLSRDESEALIAELFGYLYADDNVYTHHWRPNDVIIWDNIALQHCRPREVGAAPRHLRRLSIDGWNTESGVLDWIATGGKRDPANTPAPM